MKRGDEVQVSMSAPRMTAPASLNRVHVRAGTVLGPWNPKWERGLWRVQLDNGLVIVSSEEMLEVVHHD